jgi:hypothetical protein
MLVPLIPSSRVRVFVGPGARDRVIRNRRTMSSVVIGVLTFMTCMVPAESADSTVASIPAPLYGPLAMVACLVLITALGAAIYDYLSSDVPTACTIAHDSDARVVSASDVEDLRLLRHYYAGHEDMLRLDGDVYLFRQDRGEWSTVPMQPLVVWRED